MPSRYFRWHHPLRPAKTANLKAVHDGAGTMNFGALMNDKTLSTNFIFLHRGVLHPGGGIGQHFHNHCEEMFVIFDGEAEFTVDGRTSLLKGTVGAPDRMGSSHAIYNPTDHDVEWMNINVGTSKAMTLSTWATTVSAQPKTRSRNSSPCAWKSRC